MTDSRRKQILTLLKKHKKMDNIPQNCYAEYNEKEP